MLNEHYGARPKEKRLHFVGLKNFWQALGQLWKVIYVDSWLERVITNLAEENIGC